MVYRFFCVPLKRKYINIKYKSYEVKKLNSHRATEKKITRKGESFGLVMDLVDEEYIAIQRFILEGDFVFVYNNVFKNHNG